MNINRGNWIFLILLISLLIGGCNREYRLYKRVGGEHLHLSSNGKELFWFNGIHGHDPKNPMFSDIKAEYRQFNPDVVLVEGHANLSQLKDEISAIKSGESEYVSFLAQQGKTDCFDIEPPDSSLNDHLVSKYGKRDVLAMYLIRQMIQWGRKDKKEVNFEKIVVEYVKWENINIGYFNQEINIELISELLQPHTKLENIDNENWTDFNAQEYLYFSSNRLSEVYNETYNYRNIYLLTVIESKYNEYNRIFIMMGFDHAKEVEKDLYGIFGQLEN